MAEVMAGLQFAAGCLALGLGLFLIANAVQGVLRARLLPTIGVSALAVLGGTVLLVGGAYAAPLPPAPPARAVQPPNSLCLICHGQEGLTSTGIDGHERPVDAVEAKPFAASAHGEPARAQGHPGQAPLPPPPRSADAWA